jgi:hypothetical protein
MKLNSGYLSRFITRLELQRARFDADALPGSMFHPHSLDLVEILQLLIETVASSSAYAGRKSLS